MKKDFILAEIYRQNKHWKNQSEFFFDLKDIDYKRKLFFELQDYFEKRHILSVVGLRRVGKTVLIKQIIKQLLENQTKTENILFPTFKKQFSICFFF